MMKKERSSNIELLRIIAMLMIIVYHIWIHCIDVQLSNDTMYFIEPHFYKRLILFDIISPFGQIANAIFILISGYFMVEKKNIDLPKIAKKLISQSLFATIVLMLISTIVYKVYNSATINLIDINYFNNGSWFIGYYFAVMLSAYLFLNKFLNKLDQKKYSGFLIIMFTIIQFGWTIRIINDLASELGVYCAGIFLYSLGGYIRKYNPFKNIKTIVYSLTLFIIALMIIISNYNLNSTSIEIFYLNNYSVFKPEIEPFFNYSFVTIICAVCIFELFNRIRIKRNNVINFIGSSTLMIYLLHDNVLLYSLMKNINWVKSLNGDILSFLYNYIIWVLGIFECGLIIYIIFKLIENKYSKKIMNLMVTNNRSDNEK